ncbi:4244_t:CDS:2, partial [Scutellospora calospora]
MQNQPSDSYQYHSNFNPRAPNIVEQFALLPEYPNYQHVENITFSDEQNLQRAHTTLNYSVRDPYENKGEFESKLFGSPNHCISEQMNSAAMFDKQYLLLGNDNGLWVIDFSTHWDLIMPTQLICGCSFKKLQILEEFNIMIAIAGKKDMIRIYKLDSLLHLIKFVTNSDSKTPINLSKAPKKFTTPKCEKCGCILDENRSTPNCQNCGFDPKINSKLSNSNSSSPLSPRPSGKLNRKLTNITSHLSIYVRNYLSNSSDTMTATMWRLATDYVNLAESVKDCITFDVNETKNKMKGSQECKFEFLKSYYVPGTPHFVSVVTDLSSIKQIITITGIGKAAVIDCYTTEVTEI